MVIETVRAQIKRIEAPRPGHQRHREEARGLAEGRQVGQKAWRFPARAAGGSGDIGRCQDIQERAGVAAAFIWCRDRPAPADG